MGSHSFGSRNRRENDGYAGCETRSYVMSSTVTSCVVKLRSLAQDSRAAGIRGGLNVSWAEGSL